MPIKSLPETITKDVLLKLVQDRFQQWIKMYADPGLSAQYMYEDMSCSVVSGDTAFDFPNEKQDDTIRYQYESVNGACYFIIDGIRVDVYDLREMRKKPDSSVEMYVDVCIPCITYKDEDDNFIYHPIPDAWLYGSTSEEFNEGEAVHQSFIDAARDFIKAHHITKEMQEED